MTMAETSVTELSIYADPVHALTFDDGNVIYVHDRVLRRNAWLASLINKNDEGTIHLRNVAADAGCVLVHWLYTEEYPQIARGEERSEKKIYARLCTALRICCLASKHSVPVLSAAAYLEITLLGDQLSLLRILDAVEANYPIASDDDLWFPSWLSSTLRTATAEMTLETASAYLKDLERPRTLARMTLKLLVQMRQERLMLDAQDIPNKPNGITEKKQIALSTNLADETWRSATPEYTPSVQHEEEHLTDKEKAVEVMNSHPLDEPIVIEDIPVSRDHDPEDKRALENVAMQSAGDEWNAAYKVANTKTKRKMLRKRLRELNAANGATQQVL